MAFPFSRLNGDKSGQGHACWRGAVRGQRRALLQQTEVPPPLPWSRLPGSRAAFETLGHCANFGSLAWVTTWSLPAKEQKHWAQQ